MSHLDLSDRLFYGPDALSPEAARRLTARALDGAEDGELFLEHAVSEHLSWDDGKLKSAGYDLTRGFGLRAVSGDRFALAHAGEISEQALIRAADTVAGIGAGGTLCLPPALPNRPLYGDLNPVEEMPFADKVALLAEIDAYARAHDPSVMQVSASLAADWRVIQILRGDGSRAADVRPLVRLSIQVTCKSGDRMEGGSASAGGRGLYGPYIAPERWQAAVKEAVRQARVNLHSVPCPAGEMPVVLGPGWCGILLHEAIGHGLEGDFHRKGTSVFNGKLGQRIAAPGVTVVDDGTIEGRRGSLTIDDEGTPSRCTTLIEDGILTGLMQDRMNARLMGVEPTGNGRRQSYAHHTMPRMTNTVMLAGPHDPAELVASLDRGLYAVDFGGGQVDITSGKFVFAASEAYLVENGRIGAPVRGATLIGDGATALSRISMIGNDMALDPGMGTCGKDGQGVPVGVGQPSLRIDGLTIGGTAT